MLSDERPIQSIPLSLTVDCVVFGLDQEDLKVLLVRRKYPPFEGSWALPGGFVGPEETLEAAAARELEEEAGLRGIYLEQLYTFGDPGRDPRRRVVTVAYAALVNLEEHVPVASTDATDAAWFPLDELPPLAFDHPKILQYGHARLRNKIRYTPVGFELLPKKFTLGQLQGLYEKILGQRMDKRNFRKKVEKLGVLRPMDEYQKDVAHRAAQLWSFDPKRLQRRIKDGQSFEL